MITTLELSVISTGGYSLFRGNNILVLPKRISLIVNSLSTAANRSHKTASKEHRHEKESLLNNDFKSDFVEEKKTLGSSIDDVV